MQRPITTGNGRDDGPFYAESQPVFDGPKKSGAGHGHRASGSSPCLTGVIRLRSVARQPALRETNGALVADANRRNPGVLISRTDLPEAVHHVAILSPLEQA